MAICKKCGAQIADAAKFCPICGEVQEGFQQSSQAQNAADEFVNRVQNLNDTPDYTSEIDPADVSENRVMGILAYISWLVLIPIFAAKDSKFARFHANQGLILLICSVIISAVSWIPILGWIVGTVGGLIVFILMIIGIINVANGRAKELPVVGKYTILK